MGNIFNYIFWTSLSFKMSKQEANQIKLPKYYEDKYGGKTAKMVMGLMVSPTDKYIKDFNEKINEFVTNFNRNNKKMNRTQMVGYMVAGITSIISLRLTI